jgi:predicted nucleic acid-binding protein
MTDDLELIYWDACIFFEHLKQENVDQWKRQAVDECLTANKERLNRICTSAVTHMEVVPAKLPLGKDAEYWGLFNSLHFYDIAIDRSVVSLAREIRTFYYVAATEKAGAKMMGLGDAIHLATAVIEEADTFYTRDGKTKGGNIPLLGLPERSPGGKLCGQYDIRILSPIAAQGALALTNPKANEADPEPKGEK